MALSVRLDEVGELLLEEGEDCGDLQYLRLCLALVIGSWYMAGFSITIKSVL